MAGLASSQRWQLLPQDVRIERMLMRELGIGVLAARVLAARGVKTVEEARLFLTPSLERDWVDPLEIPGMQEAADRVYEAIARGERIAVFGDFDVDGITSTCLLTQALRVLGAAAWPFIPHRFGEGYGISEAALERMRAICDPELVITVDNGIASGNEVAWLKGQGVDVVVTDHHEPGDQVPTGVPVTDPKLSKTCRSRELAGVGVALKLVCVLGERLGKPNLWHSYIDLAALGTLSDMMPLEGENRALVAEGVELMRRSVRPGFVALAATAGINLSEISSDSLPFSIIPRLNAAGRMGTTDVAFDLLFTNDPGEAAILAGRLEEINEERRRIEQALADEALEKVAHTYDGGRVVVVAGEGWHEGVKGIVASRIVSRYHVPALLFSISDGVARGSGRSVGSVDLFHAVEQCSDVLVRFGGHSGAVGVTCEAARLDEFRARLGEVLSEVPDDEFTDRREITALVTLPELTVASIGSLDLLQPFGQGNKKPLLAATGVTMRNRACVGADGSHLRFLATDGAACVPSIMFRVPNIERVSEWDGPCDLVFDAVNETWQGRTKPKLMVRDILLCDEASDEEGSQSIADELFERASDILSRDEYSYLADARSFHTKAVGVSFEGRQAVAATLVAGDMLQVERRANNAYDTNAMALVASSGRQVGFLRRQIAAVLAPEADAGTVFEARVLGVTGGGDGRSYGVNVQVSRMGECAGGQSALKEGMAAREKLAALTPAELTRSLTQAMIGDCDLLPAQAAALERLSARQSCMAIMATGRGKSLIFHIHAARRAILERRASIFVYPLRALVADQAYHLEESFSKLGMRCAVLTGETPLDERDEVFGLVREGVVDVLLTTPEFLAIHARRFAETGRVGFVVIDEAHHAGLSKSGNRSAYAGMPEVLQTLGNPEVLAVTATAAQSVAQEVCRLMGIDSQNVISDLHVRANLQICDLRDTRARDEELVRIVGMGEKCICYVNSREQSVSLARMLRQRLPELGHRVSFYNAGLTRGERTRVEAAFREGILTCIVSTSAFGEGVNLPDIRHVILYHLPFGQVEFNQMSGRAGRDGVDACIHLMFGERDIRINERIISSQAPARSDLMALYRVLQVHARSAQEQGEDSFSMPNADLAQEACASARGISLDERSVSCGISIFRELGFLTTSGFGVARRIHMVSHPQRADLTSSVRYLEGIRAADNFQDFAEWVLCSTDRELLDQINRPIVPGFGTVIEG